MRTAHAYCRRLPGVAEAALRQNFAVLAERHWPDAPPRLWHDAVPAAADSPTALRRRDRELRRPVTDVLRAVLLGYADGTGDLVLVSHRAALAPDALLAIADVLTGAADPDSVALRPAVDLAPAAAGLSWGLGDPAAGESTRIVTVPLSGTGTDVVAGLVEAARVVADRYEPDGDPGRIGVLGDALEPVAGLALPCHEPPWPITVVPRGSVDGGVTVELHHRLRDLTAAAARRFAEQLVHVYRQLADGPADEIALLDETAATQQLALGTTTAPETVGPQRIDTAFRAAAARRPDAVALTCGARRLTYAELDEHSDRFAAGLAALGVRPADRVGVCLDRSLDLVVVLLAVLKAGAAYVPMDPAYPADRLRYTVDDAAPSVVVTDVTDFPAPDSTRVVRPAGLAGETVAPQPAGAGAAYVIYTSGSTGRPKGVVGTHDGVLALLAATEADFGFGPDDTWTLFHSSAFDFSVWEIWGPLLTGGRLVVVPYWVSRSPEEFHTLLRRERVTVLNQTPSAFLQLVDADRRQDTELELRLVIFGGEPLDPGSLLDWLNRYPETRCRLVNMYGITETTVHVTAQTITRQSALTGSRSVGRPIAGWHVRILDERGRPVPVGVPGEIHVGGAGVTLGYLNRPGLTAERFVPDPCGPGRLYRSGDVGRFTEDGRIEHLGRRDNQVQLRGFRVELDEVRHVLLADPTVTAAAVVLGGEGDLARLDAYVVLGADAPGDWPDAVRARATQMLPEHMVPATLTAIPELPLTVNGKLDRDRLPEPARTSSDPPPVSVARGRAAELAEVWEAVLGVPVGYDDNFFRLGGNSLAAVRLRTAMQARGMPELPLRQVYLTPTIRMLAEKLAHPATATRQKAPDVR